LGEIGDPQAVAPLIQILEDEDMTVRLASARALESLAVPWGTWVLQALDGDPLSDSKLGEVKDPLLFDLLIRALASKDFLVRRSAARILGRIRCPEAVAPLITALKDRNKSVRDTATRALGQIRDPRAVEPLLTTLSADESEAIVDFEAMKALGEIGDPRAGRILERIVALAGADREVMQVAREALEKMAVRGAEMKRLDQVPVCRRCWCRFAEFQARLSRWRTYRLYGCRHCQGANPRVEGVERLVLVLDRYTLEQQTENPFLLIDDVLYISWFAANRVADLDALLIGQVTQWDVQGFFIAWAEKADHRQRERLKNIIVTLLPGAQLEGNSLGLLEDKFASVKTLSESEAGIIRSIFDLKLK